MDINVTDAIDRIADLSSAEILPVTVPVGPDIPLVVLPDGKKLANIKPMLDQFATKPDRREGTDRLQDLDSFVEWVNRHKDTGTVIFCDVTRTAPRLLAIADYHYALEENALSGDGAARFGKFRALYEFPISEQWKAWRGVNKVVLDQGDFAEFLDDHALDLISPEMVEDGNGNTIPRLPNEVAQYLGFHGGRMALPGDVLTLAKGLEVTANAKNVQKVDVQSGAGTLVFESEHVGANGQKVDVPKMFMIAVPLFDRADTAYRIPVRIRYRLSGGIKWILTMLGDDQVVDGAITDAARRVAEACDRPVFLGTPS